MTRGELDAIRVRADNALAFGDRSAEIVAMDVQALLAEVERMRWRHEPTTEERAHDARTVHPFVGMSRMPASTMLADALRPKAGEMMRMGECEQCGQLT